MLKDILSVSGKPGLFKLISKAKNMFVAESLIDKKRIPVYMRDKVVSLGDISIYTEDEEVALALVLDSIKKKEDSKPLDLGKSVSNDELKAYFETILPDFDKDRVYPSDIRKVIGWYNLLVKEGLTDFLSEEETEEVVESEDA
ncbi:hypothetical protein M2138_001699 [Dysgonomonadaceae bacterium PH5-43]|nr:hypothetical protein [Dysgonomonadaceae bacterium PH5-43]